MRKRERRRCVMNVRIRRAAPGDRPTIQEATVQTAWEDVPAQERSRVDRASFENQFLPHAMEIMDSAESAVFVAEDDERHLVGYIILGTVTSMLSPFPFGFVYDIWVAPEARRRGVARLLLRHATEWCRSRKLGSLKLEVSMTNTAARELYASFGFEAERVFMSRST